MENADLARRAMACKGWRWLPGMRALGNTGSAWRLFQGSYDMLRAQGEPDGYCGGWLSAAPLMAARPDLDDPPTAGGLPKLARDAWADPTLYAQPLMSIHTGQPLGWAIRSLGVDQHLIRANTEVEAWILTLEIAP